MSQIDAISNAAPLPPQVRALYFGIVEMAFDGRAYAQVHLLGSSEYDDGDSDWACESEDSWLPAGRYLRLPNIARMGVSDFDAVHAAVGDLLRDNQEVLVAHFGSAVGRPVCYGWDDGDLSLAFVAKS